MAWILKLKLKTQKGKRVSVYKSLLEKLKLKDRFKVRSKVRERNMMLMKGRLVTTAEEVIPRKEEQKNQKLITDILEFVKKTKHQSGSNDKITCKEAKERWIVETEKRKSEPVTIHRVI